MKTLTIVILNLFVLVWIVISALAQDTSTTTKEKINVVKVTDFDGKINYKVMTQTDFKALMEEIKTESSLVPKALQIAEKKWKEDTDTKKKSFPKSAIKVKQAEIVQTFTDQNKAQEKLTKLEATEADKAKEEQKRQDEKDKVQQKKPDEIAKEKAREREKDALDGTARSLFETALTELKTKAAEKPVAPADKEKAK
jgi:hypothetical protein